MDNREQASGAVVRAPPPTNVLAQSPALGVSMHPRGRHPFIHSFILYLPHIQNFTTQDGNDMGLKKK